MVQTFAELLSWVPKSRHLGDSLAYAHDYARGQGHAEVGLEHLLMALLDDPDAKAVLEVCGIESDAISAEVEARMPEMPAGSSDEPNVAPALSKILEYAVAAARQSRRREVNGAIVLAAVVGEGKSVAADILRRNGLTFEEAIKALQTSAVKSRLQDPQGTPVQTTEEILENARRRLQKTSGTSEVPATAAGSAAAQSEPAAAETPAPAAVAKPSEAHTAGGNGNLNGTAARAEPTVARDPANAVPPSSPPPPLQDKAPGTPQSAHQAAKIPDWPPAKSLNGSADAGLSSPRTGPPPIPPVPPPAAPAIPPAPMSKGPPPRPGGEPQRWPEPVGRPGQHPGSMTLGPPGAGLNGVYPVPGEAAAVSFDPGNLVETLPRRMRVGRPETVEIRIARSQIAGIGSGLAGRGRAEQHPIVVARAMSVRLRAPDGGFFVEAASPETQWIDNNLGVYGSEFASWRFLVTPSQPDARRLQLIVSVRTVGANGLVAETALPDQVITVRVRANHARAIGRWFGWALAATIGGVLARYGEGMWAIAGPVIRSFIGPV